MSESRWPRRVMPPLAALIATLAVAASTSGARDRPWKPPTCPTSAMAPITPTPAVWWRLDPTIKAGSLAGQRLVIGTVGRARPRNMELPAESFAAGPVGGRILVGTDDGTRSRLALVDPGRGCATPLDERPEVVRRAAVSPGGRDLVEFRVERTTRADLGVYRRSLAGGGWRQLLPPIPADPAFGPTWSTELRWDLEGRRLAVQSCGAIACRTRVVDDAGRRHELVDDLDQGDLIGLAGTRIVTRVACGGLPCPLVAVDIVTGERSMLDPAAGSAVVTVDDTGRAVVVYDVGAADGRLRLVGLDGRAGRTLVDDPLGRGLVASDGRAGATPVGDWVVVGPGGRVPVDGSVGPVLRRLSTGATARLEEVAR